LHCHFRLALLEDLDDVGAELVVVTVFELAVVAQVEGDPDRVDLLFLGVSIHHVVDQRVKKSTLIDSRFEMLRQ